MSKKITSKALKRFPIMDPAQMNQAQAKLMKAVLAGPRGGGDASPAALHGFLGGGPFNAWLRSPDLGDRLQKVGEYIRFNSSLDPRLNELAILVTARYWTSQYEWFAHLTFALAAGLDARIAAALARNKRPAGMHNDEAAVYDFCTQLHRRKKVGDAVYRRAVALFGEQGVMDLIGACGYYTVVSMTLNVARVKVPAGNKKPLK